ncbi:hypothetical protein OV208_14820 [Corallococcus sp. bb12-1]|uniref:hypothetical protein n=1 Tax=Corallococcus sp. bb12-1 TaxID=2996784 RepID=UPI002270C62A|nr:hypothetical protein [Corallococcus sp. bb12-1]MCY1042595.1 hypothetical protein [Corallococcus sp. bb12-1]
MARRARPTSFPHPVVGIGDDLKGEVHCNPPDFDLGVDTTSVRVDGLAVTNPSIASLVRDGVAAFTIRVSCGATYYRETFQSRSAQIQFTLPSSTLVGDVEIQVRVCSLQRLERYHPDQLHPDYGDRTFDIQVGDVLALGDDFSLRVDKQFDPLAADIPSIMRIMKGNNVSGPFEVDFWGEQIVVLLPADAHELYGIASNSSPELIHAALVMPVLCEAIRKVRQVSDEEATMVELPWYRRLEAMLEARRINDDESALSAAQKLLDMPLLRSFRSIVRKSEED